MNRWSFKVKVGVYAALLTMAALIAGVCVMLLTLYFHQVAELDEELAEDASELVWDLKNFRNAPQDPSHPITEDFIPVPLRNHYLVVEGPDGSPVYQSANLKGQRLDQANIGEAVNARLSGRLCRVGAWKEGPYTVRIGARVSMIERFMKNLGIGFATALPVVGLVVFFGGMWLGRRTVAPVAELSAAAAKVSASNPKERLPLPGTNDEIERLTEVLNSTFDRLQDSYEAVARFSADASHQLKTPITILRAGLDHLSRSGDLTESQSREIATLLQQTRRLTSLIEDLLLLAQADAGRMALEPESVDLSTLVLGAADDLQTLVAERGIGVELDVKPDLSVRADRRMVSMALQNLVENAAKYTPEGGQVRVAAAVSGGNAVVTIANTGSPIPEADRGLLFERFRRGTETGGHVRGHGLGLNIARELIRAHGGEVSLNSSEDGWIVFQCRLPLLG